MPEAVAQPRYLVDDDGNQVAVLVDIEQYRVLLEAAEELDAIRAYDAAKASGDEAIPFEQAINPWRRPSHGLKSEAICVRPCGTKSPKLGGVDIICYSEG